MPQNWKTYKLEDALEALIDYRGKTPKKTTSGIPLVTAKIVKQGRILEPNEFIAAKDYDKWMVRGFPKVGDVVLTTEAPLGEVAQIKDSDIALAQRIVTLRGKSNTLDNGFLKYFLQSNEGQRRLVARESGTTVTGIKQSELRKVEIDCPTLPEQRAIAEILSSLDDKIELNLQMNKTLEEMAMTLYKHWFVDFEFPSSGGVTEGRGGRNTTNYMSLPYNPKLKQRAKELRKAGNLAEVLFWQQVHRKKFLGLDFDRQKIIGNYIVDFYCANVQVVVEIDGSSHDNKQEYDAARDAYLESLGLTVIHITDEAVKKDLAQTMADLKNHPAFNSPPQEEYPQGEVVSSPPQEEYPQGEVVNNPAFQGGVNNHPAFQAPLQRRGSASGYKSSGGKFIDSELGPIPEGWEVKSIGEHVDIMNSKRVPLSTAQRSTRKGKYPYYGASGVIDHIDDYLFDGEHVIISEDGENLRSRKTPVAFIANGQFWVNNHAHILKGKRNGINELLIHHFKQLDLNPYLTGAVQPKLNKQNLLFISLPLPKSLSLIEPVLNEFHSFSRILLNNILENQTLTKLRDTLLPKLISGEVRVRDVEQTVAAAL